MPLAARGPASAMPLVHHPAPQSCRHPTPLENLLSGTAQPTCPNCGADGTPPFYTVAATPVTCTSIFDTSAAALTVPTGRVELAVCRHCGLIYNGCFDPARAEVGARYESSQAASAHFGQFARGLANEWVQRHALRDRRVLEIGCGQGDFLHLLVAAGVREAIGIDPLAPASLADAARGLHVQPRLFDASTRDVAADAVVCRHTLEHVHDVSGFLRNLWHWAQADPDRVVLFELPASERLLTERAFWDIYYEHCNYFTADALRRAFEHAGFEILRIERAYGEQYLILEARAARAALASASPVDPALIEQCRSFGDEVRQTVARCDRRLEALASAGGPIVLWQGAAKTVGFVSALARRDLILGAVDLSPQRHGRFLPGSGLAVHAPEQLRSIQPKHVILMNPVYVDEVRAMLTDIGVDATLLTVNDLCAPLPAN